MNRNIQRIIDKYITYSDSILDKLVEKNNHIKKEIMNKNYKLTNCDLFDLLLRTITLGFGRIYIKHDEYVWENLFNRYNKCRYKHLYKIYEIDSIIQIELNNNKSPGINILSLLLLI